jgi:hypothetical protein
MVESNIMAMVSALVIVVGVTLLVFVCAFKSLSVDTCNGRYCCFHLRNTRRSWTKTVHSPEEDIMPNGGPIYAEPIGASYAV